MFGYYIEQAKKSGLSINGARSEASTQGFTTSIKGFQTKEEAQEALEELEKEIRDNNEFLVIESRVYEYEK